MMDYSTHLTYDLRSVIAAVVMIVMGIVMFDFQYDHVYSDPTRFILRTASAVILVVFGGLMLLPRFSHIMTSLGLMCIGLGLSRLVLALSNVIGGFAEYGSLEALAIVVRVIGLISVLFSIYMIYLGFNFLRNDALNAFILRFSSMGIAIAYTLLIIYAISFVPGISLETFWENRRDIIAMPILYFAYFMLLCSREVFDQMYMVKIRSSISRIARRINPDRITVTGVDYRNFKHTFGDRDQWDSVPEGSPVFRRISLKVRTEWSDAILLFEEWRTGKTFYTLMPPDDSGFLVAPHGELDLIIFRRGQIIVCDSGYEALRIDISVGPKDDTDDDILLDEAVVH